MDNVTDNWSKKDFLAYVLLCGAKADMKVSKSEQKFILDKLGEEPYHTARRVFEDQSDYECIQTIISLKKRFFPGEKGKEKLLGYLKELFKADGDYSTMERLMLLGLEKLL